MNNRSIQHSIWLLLIALVNSSTVAQAIDPQMLDLFEKVGNTVTGDEKQASLISNSDSAEKFRKAYLAGKTSESDRLWAELLKKLGNAKTDQALGTSIYARIVMDVPDDATVESRYSRQSFYTYLLSATEKAVGKNHRFMITAYSQLAKVYEGSRKWKEAEALRIKSAQLAEKIFGNNDAMTLNCRLDLINDQMKLQHYDNVEQRLKTILVQSKQSNYANTGRQAFDLYALYLQLNNRRADYVELYAEYPLFRPHHR